VAISRKKKHGGGEKEKKKEKKRRRGRWKGGGPSELTAEEGVISRKEEVRRPFAMRAVDRKRVTR